MIKALTILKMLLEALWSRSEKGLTSWLLCLLCFVTSQCVLVHIRFKGEGGAVKLV